MIHKTPNLSQFKLIFHQVSISSTFVRKTRAYNVDEIDGRLSHSWEEEEHSKTKGDYFGEINVKKLEQ
jgi:hypothetical protein